MNTTVVPMVTLAFLFASISIIWIGVTLKEGRKAEREIRARKIYKTKNSSIEDQKKLLNKIFKK